MSSDKDLYKRKPRLYQVALELSKFDDPYKALDALLALVMSMTKEGANHSTASSEDAD